MTNEDEKQIPRPAPMPPCSPFSPSPSPRIPGR